MKIYRRTQAGSWGIDPDLYRDGQSFELPTLSSAIAVADVYAGILDSDGGSLLR